jgi:hypothetical protein
MRFAAVLTVCLALAADAAFAAPARLTAHRLGAAPAVLGSDGARFVAWPTPDFERTAVYDARTGAIDEVARPPGVCIATGIGAGALVYTCEGAYAAIGTARLMNLRTGTVRPVVGDPPAPFGQFPARSFIAVGARWIQATVSDYHSDVSGFYSRATGEPYGGPTVFGPHVQPDLDSPGLRAPICSPLVARGRQFDPYDSNDGYWPLQIEGRNALDVIRAGRTGQTKLVLRHCGTTRHRTICRTWCFSPVLDGGQVLWADDEGILHAFDVHDRRTRAFELRGHPISAVYPVGARLVLATDQIAGKQGVQIRVARSVSATGGTVPGVASTLTRRGAARTRGTP